MRKLFRYIESKYENWFDYDPGSTPSFLRARYQGYVRFLVVMPVLVLLFLLLTLVGIFISYPNRFLGPVRRYFAHESIRVQTEGPLNPDSVRIDWHQQFTAPVTVFQNGNLKKVHFNRQGLHFFQVYYNNRPLVCFEHFKGNDWSEYDYRLKITRDPEGQFTSTLSVNNGEKFIEQGDCY